MQSNIRKNGLSISFHSITIFVINLYIVAAIAFDGTQLSSLPIASYAIYLCAGGGILYAILRRTFQVHWSYYLILLFGVLLTASMVYSPASTALKNMYLYRFWTSIILFVLISNVITTRSDIHRLLVGCVVGSIVLSLSVYIKYGFGNLITSGARLSDELGDINMLGTYCAFAFLIAFTTMMANRKMRLWCIAAMVIMLPMIMFTGSRKSILLIAAGILAFMLLWGSNRALVGKILLGIAAVYLLFMLIEKIPAFSNISGHFDDLFNLVSGSGDLDKGDINRIRFIEEGWNLFLEKPIFGHGFIGSYYYFGTYTHCNYIELLMNNGAIGCGIYYFFRGKILAKTIKLFDRTDYLLALCLIFSLILLISDIAVVTYYNRFIVVIIAICVKMIDIVKKEKGVL